MSLPPNRHEEGFTLIELLVTVLVIGILAAIALGAFASHRQKAQDADVKSTVRNAASLMAACYQEHDGYLGCTATLADGTSGLPYGPGPGEFRILSESLTGYVAEGTSEATSGGIHHLFWLTVEDGLDTVRSCSPAGEGGCGDDEDGDGLGEW